MMTATPALSSAPSSVVPSVVMIVLPMSVEQLRVVGDANHLGRIAGQDDVAAVVVAVDDRLDVLGRRFRRRVEWAIQAMVGTRALRRRRDRGHDDAVLVLRRVASGPGRAVRRSATGRVRAGPASWDRSSAFVGLRVDADVAEKAVEECVSCTIVYLAASLARESSARELDAADSTPTFGTHVIERTAFAVPACGRSRPAGRERSCDG